MQERVIGPMGELFPDPQAGRTNPRHAAWMLEMENRRAEIARQAEERVARAKAKKEAKARRKALGFGNRPAKAARKAAQKAIKLAEKGPKKVKRPTYRVPGMHPASPTGTRPQVLREWEKPQGEAAKQTRALIGQVLNQAESRFTPVSVLQAQLTAALRTAKPQRVVPELEKDQWRAVQNVIPQMAGVGGFQLLWLLKQVKRQIRERQVIEMEKLRPGQRVGVRLKGAKFGIAQATILKTQKSKATVMLDEPIRKKVREKGGRCPEHCTEKHPKPGVHIVEVPKPVMKVSPFVLVVAKAAVPVTRKNA